MPLRAHLLELYNSSASLTSGHNVAAEVCAWMTPGVSASYAGLVNVGVDPATYPNADLMQLLQQVCANSATGWLGLFGGSNDLNSWNSDDAKVRTRKAAIWAALDACTMS